jgi:hypothetical protein
VEVTRLRRAATEAAVGGAILGKLRQFPPGIANVLVIAVEDAGLAADGIGAAIRTIRARADAKDEAFFTERGIDGSRVFWDRFLRLGAVMVWPLDSVDAAAWVNGSARIAVPLRARRTIERALLAR